MTKIEFLSRLRELLSGLSETDIEERLAFYAEAIDDRVEDGFSEDEAVAEMDNPNEIAMQIIKDTPITKIVKEKLARRKLNTFEIILLIIGSPVWLSVLIALFAVVLSLYISLWAVIISFWSVFVSFVGSAFGAIIGGTMFALADNTFSGIALIAAGLVLAGLSIFAFYGCKGVTKGMAFLTKKIAFNVKNRIAKKEVA